MYCRDRHTVSLQQALGWSRNAAVKEAAGPVAPVDPDILRACSLICSIRTGDAVTTKGYNLPAKSVIHAVVVRRCRCVCAVEASRIIRGSIIRGERANPLFGFERVHRQCVSFETMCDG